MKSMKRSVTLAAIIVASATGFSSVSMPAMRLTSFGTLSTHSRPTLKLNESSQDDREDDEIERLRSMAAKLRAEAASLEV